LCFTKITPFLHKSFKNVNWGPLKSSGIKAIRRLPGTGKSPLGNLFVPRFLPFSEGRNLLPHGGHLNPWDPPKEIPFLTGSNFQKGAFSARAQIFWGLKLGNPV